MGVRRENINILSDICILSSSRSKEDAFHANKINNFMDKLELLKMHIEEGYGILNNSILWFNRLS